MMNPVFERLEELVLMFRCPIMVEGTNDQSSLT